jgi:Tfp pilus assembly protein PilO
MALDMNMDIGEAIKKLFGKSKNINLYGIYLLLVLLAGGLFYYMYYYPKMMQIQEKRDNLITMNTLKSKIKNKDLLIEQLQKNIDILQEKVNRLGPLFHNDNEVEHLFQMISSEAIRFNLVISQLKREKEKNIYMAQTKEQIDKKEAQKISHIAVPIQFTINGNYLDFLRFKEFLSQGPKVINYKYEKIEVIDSKNGSVKVNTLIHTYRVPNIQMYKSYKKEDR